MGWVGHLGYGVFGFEVGLLGMGLWGLDGMLWHNMEWHMTGWKGGENGLNIVFEALDRFGSAWAGLDGWEWEWE